jgi:hypothetical protein
MSDGQGKRILAASTISEEVVFGRPPLWKVFLSSKMRGGSLRAERTAAIEAIDSQSGLAFAWAWEKNSRAGQYCAEAVCVGHAKTCDVLILILGSDLTPVTEKEFEAAGGECAQRVILVKDGVRMRRATKEFLERQRDESTIKKFRNVSELRSHIIDALSFHAVQSARVLQAARMRGRRGLP